MGSAARGSREKKMGGDNRMGRIGNRPYWVLLLSILIRAVHQIGAAVFLVSWLIDGACGLPSFYLWLALGSGFCLVFTE